MMGPDMYPLQTSYTEDLLLYAFMRSPHGPLEIGV